MMPFNLAKFWFPEEKTKDQKAGSGMSELSYLGFKESPTVVPDLRRPPTVGGNAH